MKNEKPETRDVKQPPRDRMVRAATTRDILGRDPKSEVIAGATGLIKHPTLDRLHD